MRASCYCIYCEKRNAVTTMKTNADPTKTSGISSMRLCTDVLNTARFSASLTSPYTTSTMRKTNAAIAIPASPTWAGSFGIFIAILLVKEYLKLKVMAYFIVLLQHRTSVMAQKTIHTC